IVETGMITHTEDPTSPYYTGGGAAAGQASDLAGDSVVQSDRYALEVEWMQAVFHWVGVIDPALATLGYRTYAGRASASGLKWGGALDVISGRGMLPGAAPFPIVFPGKDAMVPITSLWGVVPEPADYCGYKTPTGLPLIVQYGPSMTSATAHSL